jgi:hypothetical protein
MQMIFRLLSVLFLFAITSVAFASNLKARGKQSGYGFFIIRSEWDDRCVAYVNGNLILVKDCSMGQAVWEGVKGQTRNIFLKNYYTGRFLSFQRGVRLPQMLGNSADALAKWNFNVVHQRNRRWPANRSYWGVTYHVIQNVGTGLCLMVNGDTVSQLNCNPGKPEHLSFEPVNFNAAWQKSPERVAEEQKANPPPAPAPRPLPVPVPVPTPAPQPVPVPVPVPTPAPQPVNNTPRRPCRRPE